MTSKSLGLNSFILLIYFLPLGVHSQMPPKCDYEPMGKLIRRIDLPGEVNYFARANAKGEVMLNAGNINRVINTKTGELGVVPGKIDPVPLWSGDFFSAIGHAVFDPKTGLASLNPTTQPVVARNGTVRDSSQNGIFLSESDLVKQGLPFAAPAMLFVRKDGETYKPILADRIPGNEYQSLGEVSRKDDRLRFRMLSANMTLNEYLYVPGKNSIRRLANETEICPNLRDLNLPVLSKDGSELSGYLHANSRRPGQTVIAKVSLKGNCPITHHFETLVGKMDFSPNGDKVAFHVDSSSPTVLMFQRPFQNNNMFPAVMDRKSGRIIPVVSDQSENAYYPIFLAEDQIAFVSTAKAAKGGDKFFLNIVQFNIKDAVCKPSNQESPPSGKPVEQGRR